MWKWIYLLRVGGVATTEECQLLEAMNKTTKEKYAQMSQMSQRLMDEMTRLQGTCKCAMVRGTNDMADNMDDRLGFCNIYGTS